jgi:hypothetical protein
MVSSGTCPVFQVIDPVTETFERTRMAQIERKSLRERPLGRLAFERMRRSYV